MRLVNRLIFAPVLLFVFGAQPIAAQEKEAFSYDLELLQRYTGRALKEPSQIDRRVVLESEGSYYILDTDNGGNFSWAIFEDLGEKGVEFSVGAAPQKEAQEQPVQALAIPVPKSACGGPGEPILAEPPYTYPLYLAYCRKAGSVNPRRGKSVVSVLPGNNDNAYVVATWELLCSDPNDAYELWVRGIYGAVCLN